MESDKYESAGKPLAATQKRPSTHVERGVRWTTTPYSGNRRASLQARSMLFACEEHAERSEAAQARF